jgi:hypothetical protein
MPLSPSFVTLLDDMCRTDLESLRDWYASCIFWSILAVVVGCVMEVPEVLHELWPTLFALRFDRPIKIVSSIGLLFVVLGVAGELSFEHWRSGYEGLLQNFENILLVDAERHAASAQQEAGDAKDSAIKAASASILANGAATDAMGLARGAREEADSFEKDIVSAKTQAAAAESHLADALQRAAHAEAELEQIRTPRSLTNTWALIDALRAFKGTEYTVVGCFQDQESIDLLVQIDKALTSAGWTRGKLPSQNPIDIHLTISKDFNVPLTTRSGVTVAVQSSESAAALQGRPTFTYAPYIRAGMLLKGRLGLSISPLQDGLDTLPLQVDPGDSTSVFIIIGKKP